MKQKLLFMHYIMILTLQSLNNYYLFKGLVVGFCMLARLQKITSFGRQEPQPAGTDKMANSIEIWENLRNNFCCKKYREPTRCSTKDSQAMISYK